MAERTAESLIRVLQWNARSLSDRTKIGELFEYLGTFNKFPEILAIQETWNSQNQKLLQIPGYKSPVSFRREKGKKGGGVATYVKEGLDSEEIKFKHTKKEIEVAITRFFGTRDTIDIANVYVPPSFAFTSDDFLEIYQKLGPKSIFLGDFNVRHELWDNELHNNCYNKGETFVEFVNQTDYVILNDGSGTRIDVNNGTFTAIDLTLVSAALWSNSEWLVGDNSMGSDHYPIVTSLNVRHKHVSQVPPQRWKLSSADWDLFRRKAADMDISFHDTDINRANDLFISDLMVACNSAIPKTRPMQKKKKIASLVE